MPRRDLYHEAVKNALVQDGWTITHDPLRVGREIRLFADLGAERLLAAERQTEKIAVEVKVFGGASPITELQKAVGQYLLYQSLLKKQEPDRQIFLAISTDTYSSFSSESEIIDYITELFIRIIVFNVSTEKIEQWI